MNFSHALCCLKNADVFASSQPSSSFLLAVVACICRQQWTGSGVTVIDRGRAKLSVRILCQCLVSNPEFRGEGWATDGLSNSWAPNYKLRSAVHTAQEHKAYGERQLTVFIVRIVTWSNNNNNNNNICMHRVNKTLLLNIMNSRTFLLPEVQ
jgi:hypothetical protein